MGAGRRDWAGRQPWFALAGILFVACQGTASPTSAHPEEVDGGDLPSPPAGIVIARDSIDIDGDSNISGTDFVVGREFTGSLPSSLQSTSGRQLVLVVRDLSNPDVGVRSWPPEHHVRQHGRDRRSGRPGASPGQSVGVHVCGSRDVFRPGEFHTGPGAPRVLTDLPRGRVRPLVEHGARCRPRTRHGLRRLDLARKSGGRTCAHRVGADHRGCSKPRTARLGGFSGRARGSRPLRRFPSLRRAATDSRGFGTRGRPPDLGVRWRAHNRPALIHGSPVASALSQARREEHAVGRKG